MEKNKTVDSYMDDINKRINSLSKDDQAGLTRLINQPESSILKKILGEEFKISSKKTTSKKRGIAARK
jgi:hypothetical protein|tara:strand:+ start:1037 stop:1240 length:204 start_codon:yes stop_codon:yes gene_type:complete